MPPHTSIQTLRPVIHLDECGVGYRPPGYQVPMRRMHRTVIEYAPSGTWLVEGGAGTRLHATAGRVFVVPTDHPHRLTQVARGGTDSHWWFCSLLDPLGRDVMREIPTPWLLSPTFSRQVIALLGELRPPTDVGSQLRFQELQCAVFRSVLEGCPVSLSWQRPADPRIDLVLHHIHEHLHKRLSRSALADLANLSPTRFHYVFTEATGVSPTQYIITQRMQRARELLYATRQSVKEIARLCGFADSSRFSRLFHAKVGLSPLEYRDNATRM